MSHTRELKWIPVESIIKNENNPRQSPAFTPEELEDLRESLRVHGVLQPVLVARYDDDMYELIDGERRWTGAKIEGVREIPAVIVDRMSAHDEVVVMYNIHHQQRGWRMAEELEAIRKLREKNGQLTDEQMARELGMSVATYKDRIRVLDMGSDVVAQIASDKLDYSSVLRTSQIAKMVVRARPQVAENIGGEKAVERKLIAKAKARPRGISQELVKWRRDLGDRNTLTDSQVEEYLKVPEANLDHIANKGASVPTRQKRTAAQLSDKIRRLESEIRTISVEELTVDGMRDLRRAVAVLTESLQTLETRIVQAQLAAN
jgi:ParB/RepB/Spo0J family partition protein